MSVKVDLKLDWCSHEAAKYACVHWHYSKSIPPAPYNLVGVWENSKFIGVVIFGRGANNNLAKPYGLKIEEACELTRIALTKHITPVSRIMAIAFKFLKKQSPLLKLCVSYADPNNGHHGGIYQATNWIYTGKTPKDYQYKDRNGRIWHSRQVSASGFKKEFGEVRKAPKFSDCERIPLEGKHRYLMPLTEEMREKVLPLAKPYPKRV